jgi:hypothetical protein
MNMRMAAQIPRGDDAQLAEYRDIAVSLLDEVLGMAPRDRYQEVDRAERAIVHLRDGLINRLRREEDASQVARLQKALGRINAAISLITGVEYPGAGIQEASLTQAREVLQDLMDQQIL